MHSFHLTLLVVLFQVVQLETPGIYIIVDDSSESEIFIRAGGTGRFLKSEESRLDLSKNDNIRLSVDLFEVLPVDKEKEFGSSETPPLSNGEFETKWFFLSTM